MPKVRVKKVYFDKVRDEYPEVNSEFDVEDARANVLVKAGVCELVTEEQSDNANEETGQDEETNEGVGQDETPDEESEEELTDGDTSSEESEEEQEDDQEESEEETSGEESQTPEEPKKPTRGRRTSNK